jgi:hypothetical protein
MKGWKDLPGDDKNVVQYVCIWLFFPFVEQYPFYRSYEVNWHVVTFHVQTGKVDLARDISLDLLLLWLSVWNEPFHMYRTLTGLSRIEYGSMTCWKNRPSGSLDLTHALWHKYTEMTYKINSSAYAASLDPVSVPAIHTFVLSRSFSGLSVS